MGGVRVMRHESAPGFRTKADLKTRNALRAKAILTALTPQAYIRLWPVAVEPTKRAPEEASEAPNNVVP